MRASSCNKSHHHACGERCSSPSGQPTQQVRTPRNPPFDSSITGGEDIGRRKEKGWRVHEKRWLHSGRYSLLDFLDCGGGKGWPVAPLLFFPSPQGGESAVAKEEGRKEDALWLPPSPLQSSPCLSNCRCMVDCFTPSILFAARRGRKEGGYRGVVVIWVWLLLVGREAVTGGEFSLPEVIQG